MGEMEVWVLQLVKARLVTAVRSPALCGEGDFWESSFNAQTLRAGKPGRAGHEMILQKESSEIKHTK
jgi:hypothetical protein